MAILLAPLGCSKSSDCGPELFDVESSQVVADLSEWLNEDGSQKKDCEELCHPRESELVACEVYDTSEPTEVQWETLRKLSGLGGAGGMSAWADPGVLELRCTHDRSTKKPECDRE